MPLFLRDLSLFALFCAAINLTNFLPSELFTYRTWEALAYQRLSAFNYGAFYRDESTRRSEYGDLAHHSEFELRKEDIVWRTDRLGNRNDEFVRAPDIVLVGDLNLTGSGVSQEDTLVNLINQSGRHRAYSIAPRNMNELAKMLTYGVIDTPRVVVFQQIERRIFTIPPFSQIEWRLVGTIVSRIRANWAAGVAFEVLDKVYSQRPFRYVKARLEGAVGMENSIQSSVDNSFFFLGDADRSPSDEDLDALADRLVRYRDFLADRNIDFIFLPVPNKRTIYYDLVPLDSQPVFLARLIRKLRAEDIRVLDTLELFNLNAGEQLLYFKDDTHWNERATLLAYSELEQQLDELE